MKAFLSFSSKDQEFVSAVARELGRQYCVFDQQAFHSGDEIINAIENKLDETSIFVLFASRESLKSLWVDFELEETRFRRARRIIAKSLVYIIDSSIRLEDIPEWLRRAIIRHEISAKIIARDIRYQLDEILRGRQNPFFIGRASEIAKIEQALMPLDGEIPPHSLSLFGLPGIGRKSLIKKTSPSILNLSKIVEMRIGEGDSINDICIIISDRTEPYSTREGFLRIASEITTLGYEDCVKRIYKNLSAMIDAGELPVFIDDGGMIDNEGFLTKPIRMMLENLSKYPDVYFFFVSNRKPKDNEVYKLPTIGIGKLGTEDTKRVLSILANDAKLSISTEEITELAYYVAGYPPAAYFAINQAKYYGLDLVMKDKTRLVEFRTSVFIRHLSKISLFDSEKQLLRILAIYSPLPLSIIANIIDGDQQSLIELIIRAIDLSLVEIDDDGFYRISDPVRNAVTSAIGLPSHQENKIVAEQINNFIKNISDTIRRLELYRVMYRAARLANDEQLAEAAFRLSSDLIRLTEELYHARRYKEAINVASTALDERPESVNARSYFIRALIQEERWDEADQQIKVLEQFTGLRDSTFLLGFLERKRGKFREAIEAYKSSISFGRQGAAINRELAMCYFAVGDLESANKYIASALEQHPDNAYVVDLWAQIASRRGDEAGAREAVNRLELIDNPMHYYHRLSRVEFIFGDVRNAEIAAEKAVNSDEYPPFEVLGQLAYCKISLGKHEEAETILDSIDGRFENIRHDIRIGLRCRLEISRGCYSDALRICQRVQDKDTYFYKCIRRDAIEGELKHSVLDDQQRVSFEKEISVLNIELDEWYIGYFMPVDPDEVSHGKFNSGPLSN